MNFLSALGFLGVPTTPLQMALYTSEVGESKEWDEQFIKRYNAQHNPKGNSMQKNAIRTLAQKASGAIAAASPSLKEKAIEYIRKATNGRVSDLNNVNDFAAGGKNAFAIVASGAVKAGINPDDILDTTVINLLNDRDLHNLSLSLRNEFQNIYSKIDAGAGIGLAGTVETARLIIAKEACEFVKNAGFGGQSLRETQVKLKLFLSLSDAELATVGELFPRFK